MNIRSRKKFHTGRTMPVMGLGTWQLREETEEIINSALKLGYTMIDTSSDYGTQRKIGKALKSSEVDRTDIFVQTKVEETDDAYKRIVSNLKELDLDYVDLTLIHRPPKNGVGEKLWERLIKAKVEGLTHDIGVSNYPIKLLDRLIKKSDEIPVVNQIEWSPFGYSDDMLDYCMESEIIIQAYSPLTRGERLNNILLKDISEKYSKNPAQILIGWNLQKGTVPIPKASKEIHLKENIDVFDVTISHEDMVILDNLNEEYSSLRNKLAYL